MADEVKTSEETVATTSKSWKETVGGFLSKKGLVIGGILVVVGGALEGTTNWATAIVEIVKSLFGG